MGWLHHVVIADSPLNSEQECELDVKFNIARGYYSTDKYCLDPEVQNLGQI